MRKFKKVLIWLSVPVVLLLLVYLFRIPIMRGMGNYLIHEDELEKSDAIFVLAGNAIDRGEEAARLFNEGWAPTVICTGEEVSIPTWGGPVITMGLWTRMVLEEHGVDTLNSEYIPVGTSTWEEFEAIRDICQERNFDKVIIVSSRFHTRRVSQVFVDSFEEAGITALIRGAPDRQFDEEEWWNYEQGMIFVNNEYMKILYYFIKY